LTWGSGKGCVMDGIERGLTATRLVDALDTLVARGTITPEQRAAILAETGAEAAGPASTAVAGGTEPAAPTRRRSLSDLLVEVGLYVGSALVLAAAVAMVWQGWEDLTRPVQVTILAGTAAVTALVGSLLSRGAGIGSARRRLSGVLLTATAASAAGAIAVAMGDGELTAVVALAAALLILIGAQLVASSAVTEIGMFVSAYALLNVAGEWLRPQGTPLRDEFGYEYYDTTTFERLMPLGGVVYGALWALLVARRLMHRELGVALGAGVAFLSSMPLAGQEQTRTLGLVCLAVLAALGFWRFLAEGFWPWLVAGIASTTAFVFWMVGVEASTPLAFLVAGLVLLGSSALGWQVARRRRGIVEGAQTRKEAPVP
jgi:hypothetical protein